MLRFNQTLENYLKVSDGKDTYNFTKFKKKKQIIDTTETKFPKIGSDLLQKRNIKCNNKTNDSKAGNFVKSTKTNSQVGYSGAESIPSVGNSFMFIETMSKNHGNNFFINFERTVFIQISDKPFYNNRFSILTNDSLESMGRFRIQLMLENKT